MVASYLIEHVNHDRYLENAKFLQDKMNYLALRMMMHDYYFHEVIDAGNKIWEEMDKIYLKFFTLLIQILTL